jgi:hypothetical protein
MQKVYTGLKGFAFLLFFIAGVVLFLSVLFWGFTQAVEFLLPLLIIAAYLLIAIFLLDILPATFFKDLRPSLSVYSVLMSHVLGVATWMMSFFFVIKAFGFWGIFFAFLFQFLAPLAIVGAMIKGSWHIAGHLLLWVSFTYGMRFYSQWLLSLNSPNQKKGDIIDVDAIEVGGHSIDSMD